MLLRQTSPRWSYFEVMRMNMEDKKDSKSISKVGSFWDKNIKIHSNSRKISWLDSQVILYDCLNLLPVDNRRMSINRWILWFKEKYVPKVLEGGLSLGCGDGTLERHAIQMKICRKMDSYDISPISVETANKINREQGLSDKITCRVGDLNAIILEKDKYDVIFSSMALHHVSNLAHLFSQITKSLKDGGFLLANEYVGPSQFQWNEKQTKIINDLLKILPKSHKLDSRTGILKDSFAGPSIEYMNENDPSEAIRSDEIIKYISKHFDIVEEIEYGGNILHMLLDGIIANFNEEKEYDVAILRLLSYIDSILISEKVMPSDFAVVLARKKEELCTLEKNRWEEVENPKMDHKESYPSSAWNMFRRSLRKKIRHIL
jgi:SAM-dependent methyltransferase